MTLNEVLSEDERKKHTVLEDAEQIKLLWEVREQRAIMGVKRDNMMRLLVTMADLERACVQQEEITYRLATEVQQLKARIKELES